jgi:hypothetical protein
MFLVVTPQNRATDSQPFSIADYPRENSYRIARGSKIQRLGNMGEVLVKILAPIDIAAF